ncbi:hypothetical protein UCDDS831_g02757 [Diplodia seriata]|uniref:Uncharacterized protein n=1 Tax=Diplodia seriata TaxID=420778 RepID=A0A0G2ENM7_9PEZI|nr:hypothetical protein UCDDS831_g02757 [Diplodia seriata]
MPDKPSALRKARRKLSALAKHNKTSNRSAAAPPSLFLQLPREIRNTIYDIAIESCASEREHDVTANPRFTDQPLYETVTAGLSAPARLRRRRLLERLMHLHRGGKPSSLIEREARARLTVQQRGSPVNLLLTCRQLSAEFSEALHLRCKLVGTVDCRPDLQVDGSAASSFDAARASEILGVRRCLMPRSFFFSDGIDGGGLDLRHVRNWEVQFNNLLPLLLRADEAAAGGHHNRPTPPPPLLQDDDLANIAATLGAALALLPACREVTLRVTLRDYEIRILRGTVRRNSYAGVVALFRPFFERLRLPEPHGVQTVNKILTVGFGVRRDPATARQAFAVRRRVERWRSDGGTGEMRVVADDERDLEYM